MENYSEYVERVNHKPFWRYCIGLCLRYKNHLKYGFYRRIARKKGATIGTDTVIPYALAKMANKNLSIGDHSVVMTKQLDLRNPINIGSNVIIGWSSKILTTSHDINSPVFSVKNGGLTIEDFAWLPANILILPSCRRIGYGAVISSGSVVSKDVECMSVVGGNPAEKFKERTCVHSDLIVESLELGDYEAFRKARKK